MLYSVVSQCSPSLESPSGVVHSQCITATSQQDIANVQSDVDIGKSLFVSELSVLRRSVDELTNTVQSYRLIVDKLSSQLNCVMRYLDINLNTSEMESPNTATTAYKSSSNATAVKDTATASATYSRVASVASAARSTRPRPTSLKEAVVSVVQADQREKERGDIYNNLLFADFLLSVIVKEFAINGRISLKYPPEYTAYFFEPPCI